MALPVTSDSTSSFLAAIWRNKENKFAEAPDFVKDAFRGACSMPAVVTTVILPLDRASVLTLMHCELPFRVVSSITVSVSTFKSLSKLNGRQNSTLFWASSPRSKFARNSRASSNHIPSSVIRLTSLLRRVKVFGHGGWSLYRTLMLQF